MQRNISYQKINESNDINDEYFEWDREKSVIKFCLGI